MESVCWNMFKLLFGTQMFLLSIGICNSLDILHFQDHCGTTITKNAAELRFDAKKLPSYLPGRKCSVTISPESALFETKTQLLFYFTKFDISIYCEDTNVTIVDGTPYGGAQISGLPQHICGHNRTLEKEGQVFTSSSNQLTVTFRRSDYGRRFSGNFSIKYVEFHTGACEGQSTYKCSNDRCIPKDYHCSNEINACGDAQDTNCSNDVEAAKGFLDSVLDILQNVLWIVAIMVGVYIFQIFYRKYHVRIRSALSKLASNSAQDNRHTSPDLHSLHSVQLDSSNTHDARATDRDQSEELPLSSGRASPVSETNYSSAVSGTSNISHNGLQSHEAEMTSSYEEQNRPEPSCPPPSYEEVMGHK